MKNEIIDEVRQQRAAILETYGGDIRKMMLALMQKQESSEHKVVAFEERKVKKGFAPNTYTQRVPH